MHSVPEQEPELLTTGKAAKLCSVKPDTVLKWIKKGRLGAVRTAGGHYRIELGEVARLMPRSRPDERSVPPPPECAPQPLRCWEYLSDQGVIREDCKKCVVYRVRAAWCFQVLDLEYDVGHAKQFCQTSCQDCAYYRLVSGLATNVLVITCDEELLKSLSGAGSESIVLRFAQNAYEASALIHSFRPGLVVLDQELAPPGDGGLLGCLASDPRVPGLRIILAAPSGETGSEMDVPRKDVVVGVIEKPFGPAQIAKVISSFPVEPLAPHNDSR